MIPGNQHKQMTNSNETGPISMAWSGVSTSRNKPQPMPIAFPRPLKPDNWQTVISDEVFVYSAHLDPWTKNGSTIRVLGSITKDRLMNPNRMQLYCKVWILDDDGQTVTVEISNVTSIADPDLFEKDFQ